MMYFSKISSQFYSWIATLLNLYFVKIQELDKSVHCKIFLNSTKAWCTNKQHHRHRVAEKMTSPLNIFSNIKGAQTLWAPSMWWLRILDPYEVGPERGLAPSPPIRGSGEYHKLPQCRRQFFFVAQWKCILRHDMSEILFLRAYYLGYMATWAPGQKYWGAQPHGKVGTYE